MTPWRLAACSALVALVLVPAGTAGAWERVDPVAGEVATTLFDDDVVPAALDPSTSAAGTSGLSTAGRAVGIASTPSGTGFWTVTADGTVRAYGAAVHRGDMRGLTLNQPMVGIVAAAGGRGYWLVAADGGVFAFGEAPFLGSTGAMRLNRPVVSMAPTPTGLGYWMVATDGGIFSFGDAAFYGSTGSIRLNRPVDGITVSSSGRGYRMVASDGGIFSFGDAPFLGSSGGDPPESPVVGMAASQGSTGYWLVTSAGDVAAFGAASNSGFADFDFHANPWPVTGITGNPAASGFRVITSDGATWAAGTTPPFGTATTPEVVNPDTPRGQPPTRGTHNFALTNADGSPGRWDPCTPIIYSIDTRGGPASWRSIAVGAFAELSAATGIQFVDGGSVTPVFNFPLPPGTPRIAVSFLHIGEHPAFRTPQDGGLSSPVAVNDGHLWHIVASEVLVNADSTFFSSDQGIEEDLLHELGHAMGLAHVADGNQVMNPVGSARFTGYQPGDREGLWNVGTARGCLRPR